MKQIQQMTVSELDKASEAIEDRRKDLSTRRVYDLFMQDSRFRGLDEKSRIALATSVAATVSVDDEMDDDQREILLTVLSAVVEAKEPCCTIK